MDWGWLRFNQWWFFLAQMFFVAAAHCDIIQAMLSQFGFRSRVANEASSSSSMGDGSTGSSLDPWGDLLAARMDAVDIDAEDAAGERVPILRRSNMIIFDEGATMVDGADDAGSSIPAPPPAPSIRGLLAVPKRRPRAKAMAQRKCVMVPIQSGDVVRILGSNEVIKKLKDIVAEFDLDYSNVTSSTDKTNRLLACLVLWKISFIVAVASQGLCSLIMGTGFDFFFSGSHSQPLHFYLDVFSVIISTSATGPGIWNVASRTMLNWTWELRWRRATQAVRLRAMRSPGTLTGKKHPWRSWTDWRFLTFGVCGHYLHAIRQPLRLRVH